MSKWVKLHYVRGHNLLWLNVRWWVRECRSVLHTTHTPDDDSEEKLHFVRGRNWVKLHFLISLLSKTEATTWQSVQWRVKECRNAIHTTHHRRLMTKVSPTSLNRQRTKLTKWVKLHIITFFCSEATNSGPACREESRCSVVRRARWSWPLVEFGHQTKMASSSKFYEEVKISSFRQKTKWGLTHFRRSTHFIAFQVKSSSLVNDDMKIYSFRHMRKWRFLHFVKRRNEDLLIFVIGRKYVRNFGRLSSLSGTALF